MKYLLLFIWLELIIVFATGCASSKERRESRGDWMEHMNYRQFDYKPLSIQWDRHNYRTEEELREIWEETYQEAIQSCIERGADE